MKTRTKTVMASGMMVTVVGGGLATLASPAWAGDAGGVQPRADCNVKSWEPVYGNGHLTGRSGASCGRANWVGSYVNIDHNNWPDEQIAGGTANAPGYYDATGKCQGRKVYYTAGKVQYVNNDGWSSVATSESGHPWRC